MVSKLILGIIVIAAGIFLPIDLLFKLGLIAVGGYLLGGMIGVIIAIIFAALVWFGVIPLPRLF